MQTEQRPARHGRAEGLLVEQVGGNLRQFAAQDFATELVQSRERLHAFLVAVVFAHPTKKEGEGVEGVVDGFLRVLIKAKSGHGVPPEVAIIGRSSLIGLSLAVNEA